MPSKRTPILKHEQIQQKILRIAYQVYESNFAEAEMVLVAIEKQGAQLADRIQPILEEISKKPVHRLNLNMDKSQPDKASLNGDADVLSGKAVVLVDDVLNSGRTLIYAAKFLLQYPIKKLNTVVLVDRRHRLFPIKADFAGLTLSTTLQNHISCEFSKTKDSVYLE